MLKSKVKAGGLVIMAAAFLLAACQSATPVAPTLDANAIYTQAAATVAAGLAQTQASQPSATPQPPTFTPTSTIDLTPSATLPVPGAGTVTATFLPGTPSPTAGTGVIVPSATKPAGGQPSVADKAEWVSQSPADKTQITKGTDITVKFVLKNVGTTTWTPKYTFRYYAGDKMGSPNDLNLTKDVKPNETVEITFLMTAPSTKGTTNTIWVMTNADGINFYSVYMELEIVD